MASYEHAQAELRAPLPKNPPLADLVRLATLAANSHNSQPWRFVLGAHGIDIMPDFSRRTPVIDPDDHHLSVSLGCAAENLLIAANALGRPAVMAFDVATQGIAIDLANATPRADPLYAAICARQSTRSVYDGRAVPAADLNKLAAAARIDGVTCLIITDKIQCETVLDYLIQANSSQMDNPAFITELKSWIRFNPAQALAMRDGLFTKTTGNAGVPTWLGEAMFRFMFNKADESKKYTAQVRSSSGIAVFIGDKADKNHWVKVGRSFQRFALQATVLGVRHAHLNQIVEIPAVRTAFAKWLGIGDNRPDLVVRFGMAPPMPMSMRRLGSAVIARPNL